MVITFQVANQNDWWFHVKDVPGSHVILKSTNQEEIPDKVAPLLRPNLPLTTINHVTVKLKSIILKEKILKNLRTVIQEW